MHVHPRTRTTTKSWERSCVYWQMQEEFFRLWNINYFTKIPYYSQDAGRRSHDNLSGSFIRELMSMLYEKEENILQQSQDKIVKKGIAY